MNRRRITVAVAAGLAAVGLSAVAPDAQADPVVDTSTSNGDIVCIAHRTIDVGVCVDDTALVLVRRLVQHPPAP